MEHNRRKKKLRTATVIKIVIAVILVAAILTGAIIFLKNRVKTQFASSSDSDIKTATVSSGSVSTTVYGTGRLKDDDVKTQDIPDGITLTEIKVAVGDTVKQNDVIALADLSSVLNAMSETQSSIEQLDKKLKDASDDEIDDSISSTVAGRVKKIYASKGDDVSSVMVSDKALLLLSLDGYMAVDVNDKSLAAGDKVKVTTSGDKTYDGEVESRSGDKVTVILTDNGPAFGDTVTVKTKAGEVIGSGELYIHDQLSVVGYAGTIKTVSVSENQKVSSGKELFKLKDTSYTANYEQILSDRRTLEENLLNLTEIYRNGALLAGYDGVIKTVPDLDDDTSNQFEICPDQKMNISVSIDETDILSLSVGQKVDVSITAVSDDTFEGVITEIDKTGTSSDNVTVYTATVQIDKTEGMLAGMSASASITIQSVDNALIIPVDALKKTSSTAYVYTSYDEENNKLGGMTEVEIGIQNSSYVEIKSGLKEGDTVYYQEKRTTSRSGFDGSFPGGGSGGSFPGGGSSGGGSFPGGGSGGSFPGGGSRSNRGNK